MAAAYEVTGNCTDDESFEFGVYLQGEDGGDFPWDSFTYEYSLDGDCGGSLSLTLGDGITIDEPEKLIRFAAPVDYRLRAGQYRHGFRIIEISSGSTRQIFDGTVTSTEGNFR